MSSTQSSHPPVAGAGLALFASASPGADEKHEPQRPRTDDLTNELPQSCNLDEAAPEAASAGRRGVVEFAFDRRALVEALGNGNEGAMVALFHEYAALVERTMGRLLGVDDELSDATQEVFLRALRSVHRVRDPQALTDWILQITVCTAADWIRKRKRRRWLVFADPTQFEGGNSIHLDESGREALRATYAVLDRLSVEERTVFALRYIDGMELTQVAKACDCSLATIKRRLSKACARFEALARREPALAQWIDLGTNETSGAEVDS